MTYNPDLLFAPAPSPAEIAQWDSLAESEYGVPALMLMENAARAACDVFALEHGITPGLDVLVLAGSGNNGGDGLALARRLHNAGCAVAVRTLKGRDSYTGIALAHYDMAGRAGVDIQIASLACQRPINGASAKNAENSPYSRQDSENSPNSFISGPVANTSGTSQTTENDFASAQGDSAHAQINLPENPAVVVDALLGAGFKGPLRDDTLALVRYINSRKNSYVLSLDTPSGLNAISGRPEPEAARANLTITFAALKPGLCLPWSAPYTGPVRVCEIGLPRALMLALPPRRRLACPQEGAVPKTAHYAHKGQKGRVLVIGGSAGFNGAPILSALAAARTGVGLITVAAPAPLCAGLSIAHPELMTLPLHGHDWEAVLGGSDGTVGPAGTELARLLDYVAGMPDHSAIVLGPGLGADKIAIKLVKYILDLPHRPPLVLDADGLRHCRALDASLLHPADLEGCIPLSMLRACDAITPHPGEMARLLSGHASVPPSLNPCAGQPFTNSSLQTQEAREAALSAAIEHTAAAVLLKGPGTLIARQGTPLTITNFAESNLAVGGSGDVLCGIIAALMARAPLPDFTSEKAAALGAYIHGRAGVACARKFPAGGNLPTDIAEAIPTALLELVRVE